MKKIGFLLSFMVLLTGCAAQEEIAVRTPFAFPKAKTIEEIIQHPRISVKLSEYQRAVGQKAIAVSEGGQWGLVVDANSAQWAAWKALQECLVMQRMPTDSIQDAQALPLQRSCFVYQVNQRVFTQPSLISMEESWKLNQRIPALTITLGHSSQSAFEEFSIHGSQQKAFAVSPGGEWGYSVAFNHREDAVKRALRNCNRFIGFRDTACLLYGVNDELAKIN